MTCAEPTDLPMTPGEVARAARDLARAERRGADALARRLRESRARLAARGLDPRTFEDAPLVLLGIGLRERGLDHAEVTRRLHRCAPAPAAAAAALRSAAWTRTHRRDLDPARLRAARRRAAVAVFLAFAAWGAIGAELLKRTLG